MSESDRQTVLAVGVLAVAIGFLAVGTRRVHPVTFDPAQGSPPVIIARPDAFNPGGPGTPPILPPPPPLPSEHQLTEAQLVENATFAGVARREGKLYFTYNPLEQRGKRSCPT
jgi:hypothetical protein